MRFCHGKIIQKHYLPELPCFLWVPVFISVLGFRGIVWRGATAQRNAPLRTPKIIYWYQRAVCSFFRHLAYSVRKILLAGSQSTYDTSSHSSCCVWCFKCYLVYDRLLAQPPLQNAAAPRSPTRSGVRPSRVPYAVRLCNESDARCISAAALLIPQSEKKMCSFLPVAACLFATSKVSWPLVLSRVYDASCDYSLCLSCMLLILVSLLLLRVAAAGTEWHISIYVLE